MRSTYPLVSALLFGLVATLQALRAILQWPVQIGTYAVPVWFSWVAAVVTGGLCVWGLTLRRRGPTP